MRQKSLLLALTLIFSACTPSGIHATATTANYPTITSTFVPSPTPVPIKFYNFKTGGAISPEILKWMIQQDLKLEDQIRYSLEWGRFYDTANPSIRPMTLADANWSIAILEWKDNEGHLKFTVVWKFDTGYPRKILLPPAATWENLSLPVSGLPVGHEIAPGQEPVIISTECLEGSDLAALGIPVGALLAAERGTGNWVMVWEDTVVARIDESGVWQVDQEALVDLKWEKYLNGAADSAENFLEMPVGDLGSFIDWLSTRKSYWITTNAQPVEIRVSRRAYATEIALRLKPESHNTELVSSLKLTGGETPVYAYVWRILNKDKTVSVLVTGVADSDEDDKQRINFLPRIMPLFAGRWKTIDSCSFTIISRINIPDMYDYWYAYLLTPEVTTLIEEEWIGTQVMPEALKGVIIPGHQVSGFVVY